MDVADAKSVALVRLGARLVDEREDGPGEQGPRSREVNRHHALQVVDVLRVSIRGPPEVEVGLCLHADLVGQRIPGLLDELAGARPLLRQGPSVDEGSTQTTSNRTALVGARI